MSEVFFLMPLLLVICGEHIISFWKPRLLTEVKKGKKKPLTHIDINANEKTNPSETMCVRETKRMRADCFIQHRRGPGDVILSVILDFMQGHHQDHQDQCLSAFIYNNNKL